MTNIDEVAARLGRIADDVARKAGPKAAEAMGHQLVREVTMNELVRYTHAPGMRTNSPRGQPPALVSGALRRSVKQEPAIGARPAGEYRWQVTVGATTVYARIQELGGWAGRHHATHLPPRPYLKPAVRRGGSSIRRAGIEAFKKAIGLR